MHYASTDSALGAVHRRHPAGLSLAAALLATLLGATVACNKSDGSGAPGGASGSAGAAQSQAELDTPLATIDGAFITIGEFQSRINAQSPYIRARYTSVEQKKEFLDNLIRFEILAGEAFRRGLDKDPDVVRTMKQVMIQKLMKDEFEDRIQPEDITDAEMKAFFDEHSEDYNQPEEVRASAIIMDNAKEAKRAADAANGEAGSTSKGFRELVNKYSVDAASKLRGGDLRYFAQDTTEVPKPVVDAAFGLAKTGDVAGPIEAGDGKIYVIKQTGRRKALTKQFDEVKRQIQNRLYRDKRTQAQKDFMDNLRAKAKIEIDEQALAKVQIDTSAGPAQADPHGHGMAPAAPPAAAVPPAAAPPETTTP